MGASRRIMLKVSAHICTQSILHVDMTFCALAHTYAKPFYVDLRLLCTHESTADIWRLRLPKMPQLGMPTVDNWDLLFDQWIPWCQYAYGRVIGEPKPSPLWLYWLVQLAERFFILDPTNLMQKACARLFRICWHWHLRNVSYFKLNNPRKPLYSEPCFIMLSHATPATLSWPWCIQKLHPSEVQQKSFLRLHLMNQQSTTSTIHKMDQAKKVGFPFFLGVLESILVIEANLCPRHRGLALC